MNRGEEIERLSSSAFLLRAAVTEWAPEILGEINRISRQSPFRRMETRRGVMSVEMTNCGEVGWLTDRRGYRYTQIDPLTGQPWPKMAEWLRKLATKAAAQVGFPDFCPNACLINKYVSGTRLGMHVDNDEADTQNPIVSFSFGVPAVFRWGGLTSREPTTNGTKASERQMPKDGLPTSSPPNWHRSLTCWAGRIGSATTALQKSTTPTSPAACTNGSCSPSATPITGKGVKAKMRPSPFDLGSVRPHSTAMIEAVESLRLHSENRQGTALDSAKHSA